MENNALVFDVATSGNFEGICLICTWTNEDGFQYWVSRDTTHTLDADGEVIDVRDGVILDRMIKEDLCSAILYMVEHYLAGYAIYGWGTTGYDMRLLAKESGMNLVNTLAIHHVDMQNNFMWEAGYAPALGMVAKWLDTPYDPNYSKLVPDNWKAGKYREVAIHAKHSVDVVRALVEQRPEEVGFIDSNGKIIKLPAMYDVMGTYYERLVNVPSFALKNGFDNANWLRGYRE